MVRPTLVLLLVAAFGLASGCTNDYDDLAYLPEDATTGPGPGPGGCNGNNDCAGDANCINGVCSCLGGSPCSGGETCCAPQGCRDLDTDNQHCGTCGESCNFGMSCNNGVCTP